MTLRATLGNENPGAFDPIPITVSLTNATSLPLAIDPIGPLRPQVLVIPEFNTSFAAEIPPVALVVDLDSRLRLLPRETVSTTFDLRWYPVGYLLNGLVTSGGIIKLTLDSNFLIDPTGNAMPGLFGQEVRAPFLRLNGVRHEPQWLEKAVASLEDPAAAPDTGHAEHRPAGAGTLAAGNAQQPRSGARSHSGDGARCDAWGIRPA